MIYQAGQSRSRLLNSVLISGSIKASLHIKYRKAFLGMAREADFYIPAGNKNTSLYFDASGPSRVNSACLSCGSTADLPLDWQPIASMWTLGTVGIRGSVRFSAPYEKPFIISHCHFRRSTHSSHIPPLPPPYRSTLSQSSPSPSSCSHGFSYQFVLRSLLVWKYSITLRLKVQMQEAVLL